jgi:hypothetical protein
MFIRVEFLSFVVIDNGIGVLPSTVPALIADRSIHGGYLYKLLNEAWS